MEPPAPAALASVTCTHCGGDLKRPEAGADGQIRCLNCGKRFALESGASPGGPKVSPDTPEAPRQLVAEPVPLAYGYLRAAGILAFLAGLGGMVLVGNEALRTISSNLDPQSGLACLTACFCFLAGSTAMLVMGHLIRLEGLIGALVWRLGRLNTPLENLGRTSLLYVAPPAGFGGMFGIFLMMDGLTTEQVDKVMIGMLVIGAGLLVGFGAENLRLLLWRQAQWAHRLRGKKEAPPPSSWSGTALLCLLPLAGLLLLIGMLLTRVRESISEVVPGLTLIGGEFILGLVALMLLRNLAGSILAWQTAGVRRHMDPLLFPVVFLPYMFSLVGLVWISITAYEMRNYLDLEFGFMFSGLCIIFGGMAIFMGRLVLELARWRAAQEALLEAEPVQCWTGIYGQIAFGLLFVGIVGVGLWAVDSCGSLYWLLGNLTWYDWLGRATSELCAALLIVYLPLWMLALLRESRCSVLIAEQALAKAHATSAAH